MDPQAQLELQDREALWVFLVREESVGCQDFLDLRYVLFFFFKRYTCCFKQKGLLYLYNLSKN